MSCGVLGRSVFRELQALLEERPEGRVPEETAVEVREILAAAGFDVARRSREGVCHVGRAIALEWTPPHLWIRVYHLYSRWADLDLWKLDLKWHRYWRAEIPLEPSRKRQEPLDVGPVGDELARLILERRPDPRLEWSKRGTVRFRTSVVLPDAPRRTMQERRARLDARIGSLLLRKRWRRLHNGWWEPPELFVTDAKVRGQEAERLVEWITRGFGDPGLAWLEPHRRRVRLRMSGILPSQPKRVRDRWQDWLVSRLDRRLRKRGWRLRDGGVFERLHHADLKECASVHVCRTCGELVQGQLPPAGVETCAHCRPRGGRPPPPTVRLCRCCGETVLERWRRSPGPSSGAREVPYCEDCCALVDGLNEELGRLVIPGTPAGVSAARGRESAAPEVEREVALVNTPFIEEARERMAVWSREVRRRILRERFPKGRGRIPLRSWDRRLENPAHKERRFREMLEFLEEGRSR